MLIVLIGVNGRVQVEHKWDKEIKEFKEFKDISLNSLNSLNSLTALAMTPHREEIATVAMLPRNDATPHRPRHAFLATATRDFSPKIF